MKRRKRERKNQEADEQMPIVAFRGVAKMLLQCTLSSPQNITFLSATVGQ